MESAAEAPTKASTFAVTLARIGPTCADSSADASPQIPAFTAKCTTASIAGTSCERSILAEALPSACTPMPPEASPSALPSNAPREAAALPFALPNSPARAITSTVAEISSSE